MMQDYDITVAVGQSRQLDAPGEYFYYNAGSAGGADSTIYLRGLSSGLRIKLKPGQGFRLPTGTSETSWVITNFAGAATIVGFVTVGDGEITDNRITGSVEVIDSGKNRTNAGQNFGLKVNLAASASNFTYIQLWNPIGSGKRLIVPQIIAKAGGNGSLVGISSAQLPTATGQNPTQKLSGSSIACVGVTYYQYSPSYAGYPLTTFLPENLLLREPEPIVITPGYGLNMVQVDLNCPFWIGMSIIQEDNT